MSKTQKLGGISIIRIQKIQIQLFVMLTDDAVSRKFYLKFKIITQALLLY